MTNDNPYRNLNKQPNGKWKIRKYYDGKEYYFGAYYSLKDAMLVRDILERINYGFKPLDPMRNISYNKANKRWVLSKDRGGERIYCGTFKTLEEAQYERDVMEAADWDFEATCGAGEITEEELINGTDWIRPKKGISEKSPSTDFHLPKGKYYEKF